jgi:hypothetical protein
MAFGQQDQKRGGFGTGLAVYHQGRDPAGGIELQVIMRSLVARRQIQTLGVEIDAEFDQHPMHRHARGAGGIIEGIGRHCVAPPRAGYCAFTFT